MNEKAYNLNECADKYRRSLYTHLSHVWTACNKLGIPFAHAEKHDASKYQPQEFIHYARRFFGPNDDPKGFALAWLHHVHNNPHHWQYWIFQDEWELDGADIELGMVEMPRIYCVEMIADWLGASMAYSGSWDMSEWLLKNLPRVRLHNKSEKFLLSVLYELGYNDVLDQFKWIGSYYVPLPSEISSATKPNDFENMKPWNENWWELTP
ncbi:MAG: DUF5662 family protein [Lutibacter sp.]|jgi:hypothetical protein